MVACVSLRDAHEMINAWKEWKVVCLSLLSVDIYIFGFMVIGFLLIGMNGCLVNRKLEEILKAIVKLNEMTEG